MQTAAAFVQVQVALNWLFDNYPRIAEWLASAGRVTALWTAFTQARRLGRHRRSTDRIVIGDSPDDDRAARGPVGRAIQRPGHDRRGRHGHRAAATSVLLTGESGTGQEHADPRHRRAVALGLRPRAAARRARASPSCRSAPTSRTARCGRCCNTPITARRAADEELAAALERCGLQHLVPRLDEEDRWDKLLSGGEQQRIGFARLLVQRPGRGDHGRGDGGAGRAQPGLDDGAVPRRAGRTPR